jgi:protein SCO1/2
MILYRGRFARKTSPIIILLGALMTCQPISQAASSVAVGGPFTLIAPDGNSVTDQTYRGKWMLVYFGYTSCPESCPLALLVMATALKKLGPEADMLQAIFITLDPQRDTRKVMGDYVQSFDPRIIGLTGTEPQIAAAARAYGAYYVRRSNGTDAQHYLLDHSTYIYLMSPQGQFVRAFDAEASVDTIAAAVSGEIKAQSLREGPTKHAAHIN